MKALVNRRPFSCCQCGPTTVAWPPALYKLFAASPCCRAGVPSDRVWGTVVPAPEEVPGTLRLRGRHHGLRGTPIIGLLYT